MVEFASMLLKGFSQIFFQENVITGALIAVGIGIASPTALLLAVFGGAISALVNRVLGYDVHLYAAGVAAFNGILIGCAVAFYAKSLPTSIVITIVASAVGGVIFYFLARNHITPYALPFTLIAFIVAAVVKTYSI